MTRLPPSLRSAAARVRSAPLAAFVALTVAAPAWAGTTTGGSMPWETPLQTIEASLSGPVAKAVGIIAIVITGLGFAVSESGSVVRKGMGIVCGLAIALTATTFITTLFTATSGAVF